MKKLFGVVCVFHALCLVALAAPVSNAFTYQGRLNQAGTPASGTYDFTFQLFNELTGGMPVTGALTNTAVPVSEGLFTVRLDFGSSAFDGDARWLEIAVRTNGNGPFVTLNPRQEISPSPYALYAPRAGSAAIASSVTAGAITSASLATGAVGASQLASNSITAEHLASGAAVANLAASGQAGVASGGMLLSLNDSPALAEAGYERVGSVATADKWLQRIANAPSFAARKNHDAVWTGSEMLIWGGNAVGSLADGLRYNPATETWKAMSAINAPTGRENPAPVWTGSEMMVWGGYSVSLGYVRDGGRYNPATDSWRGMSTNGAPTPRRDHSTVWTGSRMIVWGGYNGSMLLGDGGVYDPVTDTWTSVSTNNAPSAREWHTAVWTGSEMIVWDGGPGNGGRYNPVTDTWTSVSTNGAPAARSSHTAVWTGTEMIVWGASTNVGGRYDPASDIWAALPTDGAPNSRRAGHKAVWTGSEMIVWGGGYGYNLSYPPYTYIYVPYSDGGRYNPSSNTWTMITNDVPPGRGGHSAVWTGEEMIIWGGGTPTLLNDGGRYRPATDTWNLINSSGLPFARSGHSAVWTGAEMIVWGGNNSPSSYTPYCIKNGDRFNPASNTWTLVNSSNVPSARYGHVAAWTGNEMIIWGGRNNTTTLSDGGIYSPGSNTWTTMATNGGPNVTQAAVWTGSEFIVGGTNAWARYSPSSNSWTAIGTNGAPPPRSGYSAVWTGGQLIVWGGLQGTNLLNNGFRCDSVSGTWTPIATNGAPAPRFSHTAIWTGTEMIVWAGGTNVWGSSGNDGGAYNPVTDSWSLLSTNNAPSARSGHSAVWTGTEMIIWGGGQLKDGAKYDPVAKVWTPLPSVGAVGRGSHSAVWTGSEMLMWGGGYVTNSYVHLNDTWSFTPARTMSLYLKP